MIQELLIIFRCVSHARLWVPLKNGVIIEMGIASTYIIFLGFSSFWVKSHWVHLTVLKHNISKKLLGLKLCVRAPEFETPS